MIFKPTKFQQSKISEISTKVTQSLLQNIDKKYPIFVSLNPGEKINKDKIYNTHQLEHPIFDYAALEAQNKIPALQGRNLSFFCGAYHKYGFHEDGVLSSIEAVKKLKAIDIK